jgi:hypothetical protein
MSNKYKLHPILEEEPRSAKVTKKDRETFKRTDNKPAERLKPRSAKPKRKPVWVYLKESERMKLEDAAIEAEESISEYIRGVLKKVAKI